MRQIHPETGGYNLRSGLVIYPTQQEAIETLLSKLMQQIPAAFILLADVTGQVVSTRGGQGEINTVSLGSLVAGDLAASHEIARLTGQFQEYQLVLREGSTTHTFICEGGHHLAMLVQVSTEVPLGWARMIIRKAAQRLSEIADAPLEANQEAEEMIAELDLDTDDFSTLFGEALDDLWTE